MSEITYISTWFFKSWGITVPEDWLLACFEWIKSENLNNSLTSIELCNNIFDQWLASDLREIGSSCLPSEIMQMDKYYLEGVFPLQLLSIVEIQNSLYSQLHETPNSGIVKDKISNNRMLMMDFTDGSQNIKAIELEKIDSLDTKMDLGTKVIIHGKILCRLGLMMLKPLNVKILVGVVKINEEESSTTNFVKNYLQSNIEFIQRPNPSSLPRVVFNNNTLDTIPSNLNSSILTHAESNKNKIKQTNFHEQKYNSNKNIANKTNHTNKTSDNCSNKLYHQNSSNSFISQNNNINTDSGLFFTNNTSWISKETNETTIINETNIQSCDSKHNINNSSQVDINNEDFERINEDFFNDMNEFALFTNEIVDDIINDSEIKEVDKNLSVKSSSFTDQINNDEIESVKQSFVYLKHIIEKGLIGTYSIKAYISTIVNKLQHNDGKYWSLIAKLNDGSSSLDVALSEEVLNKLIGFTAQEWQIMKENKQSYALVKEKVKEGINSCTQALVDFSGILKIKIDSNYEKTTVLQIRMVEKNDIILLKSSISRIVN